MDAMASKARSVDGMPTSLLDLGYDNCGLDDAWQACGAGVQGTFYTSSGDPIVNESTFPSLKGMVAHGHGHGLHVGFYANNCICGFGPGTFTGDMLDKVYAGTLQTIVDSGFDGVKFDSCSDLQNMSHWAHLLAAANRSLLLENCHNSFSQDPCPGAKSCPETAECPFTMWRTSGDIGPNFGSSEPCSTRPLCAVRTPGFVSAQSFVCGSPRQPPHNAPVAWRRGSLLSRPLLDKPHLEAWTLGVPRYGTRRNSKRRPPFLSSRIGRLSLPLPGSLRWGTA